MGNYKFTNEAKEDLIRIYIYGVKKFGIQQADKYHLEFEEYFEIISNRPYTYQIAEYLNGDCRRYVHKSNTIYFQIMEDEILIVRVIGMQDV